MRTRVQNMVAKHACRALANLYLGWAAIVCPFDGGVSDGDEWQQAKSAVLHQELQARRRKRAAAGGGDAWGGVVPGGGADTSVMCTAAAASGVRVPAAAAPEDGNADATGTGTGISDTTGAGGNTGATAATVARRRRRERLPDELKQSLRMVGSWQRLTSDVRESWRAIRGKWTTWHSTTPPSAASGFQHLP